MSEPVKLYVVIPCYNETEVIDDTAKKIAKKLTVMMRRGGVAKDSRIVFVDDGSRDDTWQKIEKLCSGSELFQGVKLSRNRGHQNALLAGLMTVKDRCDVTISIDADLQDDINCFDDMIKAYHDGAEIVYGVRSDRMTDSWFKRSTAQAFYRLMSRMGVDSVYNHADFRLMSSRALQELEGFREVNLFLRGIVPLIGFKTAVVEYERAERLAGESKYPLRKMLNFAVDGITSFSVKPLRLVLSIGLTASLISVAILLYSLVQYVRGNTVSGWTFTVFSIWLIGGMQMLSLGVIGEYIGKIYSEVKARPRFIIEKDLHG